MKQMSNFPTTAKKMQSCSTSREISTKTFELAQPT
ncbi:hypothetical protein X963_5626 [Burkholderia pseudomallei MSHR7498]|nr:hypothetical protein X989_5664 [Burkholderia pseudomallei MSHR4378]KGS91893.1 hypothetical protein X963_5626 [Burkholderia pseudomallei MSHR7498]